MLFSFKRAGEGPYHLQSLTAFTMLFQLIHGLHKASENSAVNWHRGSKYNITTWYSESDFLADSVWIGT